MNELVVIVMIILSIIGWVSNALNENKRKGQAGGAQRRPQKKRRLQDELEAFINELQGNKPDPQQRKRPQPRKPQRQVIHQQRQQKKNRVRSETKKNQQVSRRRSSETPASAPSPQVAHSHAQSVFKNKKTQVGSGDLGMELKKHVETFSSQHPGTMAEELDKKEKKSGRLAAPKRTSGTARQVCELLHSAKSVRTAIILSEILQPPVSQRSRRF